MESSLVICAQRVPAASWKKGNAMPAPFAKDVYDDTLSRGLMAKLDVMRLTGEKLVEEHRIRAAQALLSAGITLIPSTHLLDHQFVVSPGVYAAAKQLCEGG